MKIGVMIRKGLDFAPPGLRCWLTSRLGRGRVLRGRRAYIHSSVQILGRAQVSLGDNSVLSQECWLNVNHRKTDERVIRIGANCFIGRRNFFSSGRSIIIGDYVLTAHDCHFLGSTHLVSDPLVPVLSTGTSDADSIAVGANTFIGAGVCVLGNVSIGHGCVIGARSVVTKNIPPFSQAFGSPAIVRKRFSFLSKQWIPAEDFSRAEEEALPSEDHYHAVLRSHGNIRMPYIAAGSDMGSC